MSQPLPEDDAFTLEAEAWIRHNLPYLKSLNPDDLTGMADLLVHNVKDAYWRLVKYPDPVRDALGPDVTMTGNAHLTNNPVNIWTWLRDQHMANAHYILKCEYCQTVTGQCRCADPDKRVIWTVCPKCLAEDPTRHEAKA